MMCHSSRVPITPTSTGQCRHRRRRDARASAAGPAADPAPPVRRSRRSRTARRPPSTASLSGVGLVMNRVSTSMRADRPRWTGDLQVGEDPGHLWLLIRRQGARRAGDADEVRADRAGVGPHPQGAAGARPRPPRGVRPRRPCRGRPRSPSRRWPGRTDRCGRRRCRRAGWWRTPRRRPAGRRGDRRAGDRHVERLGRPGDQRRGDVADRAARSRALGPQDGGGGLRDRQQRGQPHSRMPGRCRRGLATSRGDPGGFGTSALGTRVDGRRTRPANPVRADAKCRVGIGVPGWSSGCSTRCRASGRAQRCRAPQPAAGGGAEFQAGRGGVRVERVSRCSAPQSRNQSSLQIGGHRGRAEQQFADAQRAAADVVHHRGVGVGAEPVRAGSATSAPR